jgi:hypothetical protein
MALPVPPNTTCDVYRTGNAPPSAPDVPAVPCFLSCDWRGGQEAGDRNANNLTWTHIMLVDGKLDLRDGYVGQSTFSPQDTVYIPNHSGTPFVVIFIERLQRGTAHEHASSSIARFRPGPPMNSNPNA